MTIDTRHWTYCNLGPLSDEQPCSLSENHLQGSGGGVITVTGTINLKGIVRPSPGDVVYIAYSDGQNWIARIPEKLRVLNSFADPMRDMTTVLVGCKFAYMKDRKPPIQNLTERDANTDIPEIDRIAYTQSIKASTVVEHILSNLGLTAAGPIPFTNSRIIDEWDLSAGYVQELATIAEAECYRCKLNENEQVVFIDLNQGINPGPLVTQFELIDLSPQTVGELPADSVYAKYQRTQLKPPDNDPNDPNDDDKRKKRNWEYDRSESIEQYIHTYTDINGETREERGYSNRISISRAYYDSRDRVKWREETSIELLGVRTSRTSFVYEAAPPEPDPITGQLPPPDPRKDYTVVKTETHEETSPLGGIAGSCGFEGSIGSLRALAAVPSNTRITSYDRDTETGITKTRITNKVQYISTPFGSDAISKKSQDLPDRNDINWLAEVTGVMNYASALVEYGSETRIRTEREYGLQKRPGQQERNKAADQKTPSTEQTAEIIWAVGSVTSQTALELSPPYVSDDRIVKSVINNVISYSVVPSDAPQKALNYATIENRLLLANRSGAGVQLRPIDVPPMPFDLFYVRLNGCTAAYRVNGRTWNFTSDGIIVTIDGLFWGAIDGEISDAWFPLPPGITALPATAAVTINANPRPANAISIPNGFNSLNPDLNSLFSLLPTNEPPIYKKIINPSHIVKPYHETIDLVGGIAIGAELEIQTWVATEIEIAGGIAIGGEIESSELLTIGASIQEIDQVIVVPYIVDGLPLPAGDLFEFTSSTYNPNGYTFDNNKLKLTVTDFANYSNTVLFKASYDAGLNQFRFEITNAPLNGTDIGPNYLLENVNATYKTIKKVSCIITGYNSAVSHQVFLLGDYNGDALFEYDGVNVTTTDFNNANNGIGLTHLEVIPTITSNTSSTVKYIHTIDFW